MHSSTKTQPFPVGGAVGATGVAWRTALAVLAAALVGIVAIFWETAASAVLVWTHSATFNHCFLIVPISGWLIWQRRAALAGCAPRPSAWGLVVLAAGGALWLVGELASFNEPKHFALVTMIQGAVLAVLGGTVYRRLLFPLLYLYFLVPTGEFLVRPLQDFTAAFVVAGLNLVGVPVYSDGVFIEIPNGLFEVAEACAGLRFLIASIAFGALFANIVYRSTGRRLAFLVASTVVPIIANGFRAFGIVMLAYVSNNAIAVGVDHIVYGWGFFAAVTLLLIWIGLKFQEPEAEAPPPPARGRGRAGSAPALIAAGVVVLGLAVVPRAYAGWIAARAADADVAALQLPAATAATVPAADSWMPVLPGADRELRASYGEGADAVQFYIGFFARQDDGRKIISSRNAIVDDETWSRLGGGRMTATVDGRDRDVLYERITDGSRRRLVLYWYWVDGQFTASRAAAKLLQVKAELTGGDRSAALVAVAADYRDTPDEASSRLAAFLAGMPPLAPLLARADGGR